MQSFAVRNRCDTQTLRCPTLWMSTLVELLSVMQAFYCTHALINPRFEASVEGDAFCLEAQGVIRDYLVALGHQGAEYLRNHMPDSEHVLVVLKICLVAKSGPHVMTSKDMFGTAIVFASR